jgi:hypothetical protein
MWWSSLRRSARSWLGAARRRARGVLLAASGPALAGALERAARRSPARAGVALVYHGVGEPPGDLERELLPVHGSRLFAEQVCYLSGRYRLLPASRLLDAAAERRPGDPFPLAITFDDDLRSHVETAAPILARAGVPATDGFEIGFHTRRHHLLPRLATADLDTAMAEGRAELDEVAGGRLTTISYPHGRADARVADAARAAGFAAGFTGVPAGVVTPRSEPLLLCRLSPSYASVDELAVTVGLALRSAASR